MHFSAELQKQMLQLARSAIASHLNIEPLISCEAEQLNENGASFVTLTKNGNLRGCIGSLQASRPLQEDIVQNALAAAFRDPRFRPLTSSELPLVTIEVSVLTEPEAVTFNSTEELFSLIRPDVDGVIIEKGYHRATFLPQVWLQLPTHPQFFSHLLQKAALPEDTPLTDLTVQRYQVEKFTEH